MIALDRQTDAPRRIEAPRCRCPEMRLGQLLAALGMLGEDATGRGLRDIEDSDLSSAVERLAADLRRRDHA